MRKNAQKISIRKLNSIFAGQSVKITHTGNPALKSETGICKIFHKTECGADIELENGNRYGLVPDTMTDNAVEGNLGYMIAGRRRVQLESEKAETKKRPAHEVLVDIMMQKGHIRNLPGMQAVHPNQQSILAAVALAEMHIPNEGLGIVRKAVKDYWLQGPYGNLAAALCHLNKAQGLGLELKR